MIYLDNAATSWPKPDCVIEAVSRCMREYGANPGRGGHRMSMQAADVVYECRENLSRLFAIDDPLCLSFTRNATEAINLAVKGLLNPGDHVIISPLEHNSVLRPLKHLESKGVEFTVADGDEHGRVSSETVARAIRPNTRLILITHASNVTGTIQPVAEIGTLAHERGILFMVDAAQTAGHVPIDVEQMHIDLLAFPGHKGLLGPQGTGALYAHKSIVLRPLIEGGTGSQSENPYQPDFTPDRYESGTLNTPGIAGLNEGVKFLLDKSVSAIQEHDQALTRQALEAFNQISGLCIYGLPTPSERTGVIALNLSGQDCNVVCEALDRRFDIAARGGLHCAWLTHQALGTLGTGAVRLSWGVFNTSQDIEDTAKAFRGIRN